MGGDQTKEQILTDFASRIFSAMLDEIVLDTALQSHKEILRSRMVCEVCNTKCGSVHVPISAAAAAATVGSTPPSVNSQPVPDSPMTKATNGGTSTPTGKEKGDSNIYLDCLNCKRQIASNRYAGHLASCLGIGTGSRRAPPRGVAGNKVKLSTDAGRSASPYVTPEVGTEAEAPAVPIKGKAKSKKKAAASAGETNGNNKRALSPSAPSQKKQKKQKTAPATQELIFIDSNPVSMNTSASQSLTESKGHGPSSLQASSTTSVLGGSSPSGSVYSSPETPSASASIASPHHQPSPSVTITSQSRPSTLPPKPKLTPSKSSFTRALPGSSKGRAIAKKQLDDLSAEPRLAQRSMSPLPARANLVGNPAID